MAKKTRVQIDVNDIFLDNAHDAESKIKAIRSPAWPVIVAVYSLLNKEVKLGPTYHDSDKSIFHILTTSGLAVGCVKYMPTSNVTVVMTADHPLGRSRNGLSETYNYTNSLETNNPRYAVSKLSPNSKHDIVDGLARSYSAAKTLPSEIVQNLLHHLPSVMANTNVRPPRMRIDDAESAAMVRMLIGGEPESKFPKIMTGLRQTYANYAAAYSVFKDHLDNAAKVFSSDKWVVVPRFLGGIIVGAISNQPILAAYETYKEEGNLPAYNLFNFTDVLIPFKWYKSVEHIPQEIRSELELSAVMFMTHTNSSGIFEIPEFSNEVKAWESIEACVYEGYTTDHCKVMFLNK